MRRTALIGRPIWTTSAPPHPLPRGRQVLEVGTGGEMEMPGPFAFIVRLIEGEKLGEWTSGQIPAWRPGFRQPLVTHSDQALPVGSRTSPARLFVIDEYLQRTRPDLLILAHLGHGTS